MSKAVISSAADAELFQSHGSRIEAFFNLDDFVKRLINPMIQASAVDAKTQTAVVFDDGSFDNTDCFRPPLREQGTGLYDPTGNQ